jgi:hypothetical protein
VLWLAGGYVVVGISVVFLFWTAGALPDLFYANVVWPLSRYSDANAVTYGAGTFEFYWSKWTASLVPEVSPLIGYSASGILLVPLLFLMALPGLLAAFAVRCRSLAFTRHTLPYWCAGSALWLSEIHRKDITHLAYGSPLLIILFLYLCRQHVRGWSQWALQFVAICAFVLAGFHGLVALSGRTEIATPRGVVRTFGEDPVLAFLKVHSKPGDEVFAYPGLPTSYFLAGAKNPTRFSLLIYDLHTDSQFREAVRSLEEKKVRYVVWDRVFEYESARWVFPPHWVFREKDRLIIEPYLLEHYDTVASMNSVRLLQRRDGPHGGGLARK